MDDKLLIDSFTEKSIAGLKEEHFEKLWEPGDHMYRGEFVSPTRPETYFASDAEVDAYRDALARMDGSIDAPVPVQQSAPVVSEAAQEQVRADRDPLIAAISASTSQAESSGYRYVDANDHDRDDDDDDDDDDHDDDDDDHDRDDDDD